MYNSANEDFGKDIEKTKKLLENLNFDIQQKTLLQSQGKAIASNDDAIKEKIFKIEAMIKSFINLLKDWEIDPSLYNLTLREVERRRNQINEIKSSLQELKTRATQNPSLFKEKNELFKESSKNTGKDSSKNQYQKNQEIIENQKLALKKQDDQIDNLIGNVGQIKVIGQVMGQEISEQNVIIDQLNNNVDKNTRQMEKTSSKFTKILENSSTWKLFLIIGVEIAILVIIIIFA